MSALFAYDPFSDFQVNMGYQKSHLIAAFNNADCIFGVILEGNASSCSRVNTVLLWL